MAGDGGAHAGTVLEFVVPEALEAGGEELAGAGEEVEVEEGVAEGVGGGELVGEEAGGIDLGPDCDGFEVVAEVGEDGVVGGEAGVGCGLE